MEKPVSIYVLEDPEDGSIFYVGKTESKLAVRLRGHICDALAGRHAGSAEIQKIIASGSRPIIREIAVVAAGEDWVTVERKWIAHYRTIGKITNRSDGGQGVSGVLRSAEWLARIVASRRASGKGEDGTKRAAAKNRGRIQSTKEREMRAGLDFDRSHRPETKAKISASHMGLRHTDEIIKLIADKRRGFTHTEDAKQRITAAAKAQAHLRSEEQKARWEDPEYYARVTASMRDRDPPAQVTRDKLKATTTAGWADDGIRRKREEGMQASKQDPGYREKHHNQMKAKWDDPVWRAERLAAQAEGRQKKKLATPET